MCFNNNVEYALGGVLDGALVLVVRVNSVLRSEWRAQQSTRGLLDVDKLQDQE